MGLERMNVNVLVIDDDPVFRNLLQSILKEKLNVFAVETPSVAFKILKNERIDIVICDFKLPEMNGIEVLERIKDEYPEIEVIMISSSGDMDTVIHSLRKGATDFFRKPFTAAEIWVSIERTRKIASLNNNIKQYKKKNSILSEEVNREFGQAIVGKASSLQNVRQQMKMVAATPDTSVLIIGESGTGKELVARGIHNISSRKEEMFGAVNMSAIPESLFESEFFGHKKGSFTGAIADKAGWFESANGGTLFFDEIGEMSMPLQVKLLRVLEDRSYVKLGTQREQAFNIRIVAATNKTVDELTRGNHFRLDLFHRLATFVIDLPPLRERLEDLPEISLHFLHILSKKMGKNIKSIHPSVFEMLNRYSFPGNIRELRNLIERAVIMCPSEELLPAHFGNLNLSINGNQHSMPVDEIFDLRELEKQTIIRALQKVNYNKAEAARILNLEWNALYRRIQKFEIPFAKGLED